MAQRASSGVSIPVKLPTIGILGTSTEDGRTPRAPSHGWSRHPNLHRRARSSGGPVRQSPLASASAQKEIDETTGKFLRRRGDIANMHFELLVLGGVD